jgi:hypothetical protein
VYVGATSQMLVSVASECNKKRSVLHFVNATPKVAQSISSTLPSADIAFLPKVMSSWFNEQPYRKPHIHPMIGIPLILSKVDKDDVTKEIQMDEIAGKGTWVSKKKLIKFCKTTWFTYRSKIRTPFSVYKQLYCRR